MNEINYQKVKLDNQNSKQKTAGFLGKMQISKIIYNVNIYRKSLLKEEFSKNLSFYGQKIADNCKTVVTGKKCYFLKVV